MDKEQPRCKRHYSEMYKHIICYILYLGTCQMHEHINTKEKDQLPYDSNEVPKLNEVVGNLNPRREIVSLPDGKLLKW